MKKKLTFEQSLQRLEEIADLMEDGTNSLDQSLNLFEEANELSAFCIKVLEETRQKIQVLNKENETLRLIDASLDDDGE